MLPSASDLLTFVRSRRELHLATLDKHKGFMVPSLPDGVEITPDSTGEPRRVSLEMMQRFCDEYGRCESTKPGTYRKVTFDASYVLAIVDRFRRDHRP